MRKRWFLCDREWRGIRVVLLLFIFCFLHTLPIVAQMAREVSDKAELVSSTEHSDYQIFFPFVSSAKLYSFFVAGHTYGIPEVNNPGLHPPFKALWPQINSKSLAFGIFTGDIVIRGTDADWNEVDADLGDLISPVHFVVGNHDMTDRELFIQRYGPTYYSFEYANDLFIVLDSEIDHCDIIGEQMAFLQAVLEEGSWQNVFVFLHKLVWIIEDTPYYVLSSRVNNIKDYNLHANFWTDVEPLLSSLDAEVYVIAGDIGVSWAMSMFYDVYGNMHLIASGMGGAREENYLLFNVDDDGVEIIAQRLDGQPLNQGRLEAYNLFYYSDIQRRLALRKTE